MLGESADPETEAAALVPAPEEVGAGRDVSVRSPTLGGIRAASRRIVNLDRRKGRDRSRLGGEAGELVFEPCYVEDWPRAPTPAFEGRDDPAQFAHAIPQTIQLPRREPDDTEPWFRDLVLKAKPGHRWATDEENVRGLPLGGERDRANGCWRDEARRFPSLTGDIPEGEELGEDLVHAGHEIGFVGERSQSGARCAHERPSQRWAENVGLCTQRLRHEWAR